MIIGDLGHHHVPFGIPGRAMEYRKKEQPENREKSPDRIRHLKVAIIGVRGLKSSPTNGLQRN